MVNQKSTFFFLFFSFVLSHTALGTPGKISVELKWKYEKSNLHMKVYSPKEEYALLISKTGTVAKQADLPIEKNLNGKLTISKQSSTSAVLVLENKTSEDIYFFAVPHEHNPPQSSAGHYFECLCNGKVYHVPPNKTWYRIVRLNMSEYFNNFKSFEIEHQIVQISAKEAKGIYKDRLYDGN